MKKYLALLIMVLLAFTLLTGCRADPDDNGNGNGVVATPTPAPADPGPADPGPADPGPADPDPADPDPADPEPEAPPAVGAEFDANWTPADIGPTEIRVAWWGNDARHDAVNAALNLFQERYEHITVSREYGAFDGFLTNLQLTLAGEVAPDIFQTNFAWVHNIGVDGANPYFDLNRVAGILDLSEWTPEMLASMTTTDGQLGAVPHGMTGRVILYSRAMLAEYGLDTFPATVDELIALGIQASIGNDAVDIGTNTYALFPLGAPSNNLTLDIMILTWLLNSTDVPFAIGNQLQHSVDDVYAVFSALQRMIESGTMSTAEQHTGPADSTNPVWTEGRAAAVFEWGNNIFVPAAAYRGLGSPTNDAEHQELMDALGIAPIPALTPGCGQLSMQRPSLGHAISPHTEHPELAAYLLNFLYTDEEALGILGAAFGIPLSTSAAAIAERDGAIAGLQALGLDSLLAYPGSMCALFEDGTIRPERLAVIEEFWGGLLTAREAAEQWLSRQQAALDS